MSTIKDISSEFATLLNELQQSPENPIVKQALIRRLPEMKALAKVNPLALFRLAQIYAESSIQYRQMMLQSADAGCTNAMLAVCQFLVKSQLPQDVKKAVGYFRKIASSNDSYIKELSNELLINSPDLQAEINAQSGGDSYSRARFFQVSPDKKEELSAECTQNHYTPV